MTTKLLDKKERAVAADRFVSAIKKPCISETRQGSLRDIVQILLRTLTPEGARQWLRARNRVLKGRRPIDVFAKGDVEAVREAAISCAEGYHV
ncbi:MAG: hypothetical protein AAB434_07015 [Planctomycetota bacterium]